MKDIIRDSSFGQVLRLATGNRILKYREELPSFNCPGCYKDELLNEKGEGNSAAEISEAPTIDGDVPVPSQLPETKLEVEEPLPDTESSTGDEDEDDDVERRGSERRGSTIGATYSLWKIPTQAELHQTYSQQGRAERAVSRPIVPAKTSDGTILVDWWTTGI